MKRLSAIAAVLVLATGALAPVASVHAEGAADGLKSGMQAGLGELDKTLDKVGATADQKTKIKAILFDAIMSMSSAAAPVKVTVQTFGQALMSPTVDRAQLEHARVMMVGNFDAFSKVMVKAVGDAADVLTPEQRAKLAALAKKKGS